MSPLKYPAAHTHEPSEGDVEKRGELPLAENYVTKDGYDASRNDNGPLSRSLGQSETVPTPILLKGKLAHWNARVEGLAGLEARGIARVLPHEKQNGGVRGHIQMFALWFSMNLVAINIITGFLGPLVFQLGWTDCVCIVIFANALSACAGSYASTFGPESGNRTMVSMRR